MQGPSEDQREGSRPHASDPRGGGQDPSGSHQGGDNVPTADVSDPRGSQDIEMADVATGSDAVITPEGGRAEGDPVAPTPPERTQVPPMHEREQTSEQAR